MYELNHPYSDNARNIRKMQQIQSPSPATPAAPAECPVDVQIPPLEPSSEVFDNVTSTTEQFTQTSPKCGPPSKKAKSSESQMDKSKISIVELKSICKQLGVKGYSKKTKNEIIQLLLQKFCDDPKVQRIELLVKNVQYLKKICHDLQIRGYSKKKKTELVDIICEVRQHNQKLLDQLDEFLQQDNRQVDPLYKSFFLKSLCKMETKNIMFSVAAAAKCIFGKHGEIEKEIVKLFYKRIIKRCPPPQVTAAETPETSAETPETSAETPAISPETPETSAETTTPAENPVESQSKSRKKSSKSKSKHKKNKKQKQ